MSTDDTPEADRLDGAPHPRETAALHGHAEAEAALLDAYRSGRMPHAWIVAGPAGAGRATLAYRLARFVLAHPDPAAADVAAAHDLAVDPDHPAARQVARLSHPDLLVLRRAWNPNRKTFFADIRVDEARRAVSFFGATAGAGGWRVAIADTADDFNPQAANAILKVLEEPPPRSLILLLTAAPQSLLPTIRSRCRLLALQPLDPTEVRAILAETGLGEGADEAVLEEAAAASDGSVRQAAALLAPEALALRAEVGRLLGALPAVDRVAAFALAERVAGRDGERRFAQMSEQVLDWLHARAGAAIAAGEPRLARWAELWEKTARAAREAETYNLDRRPLVLALVDDLARAARG
ncbi:MAG TPA: DNA polymerase III subunit delta' [Hyphomicrobiales bacterium]|nr:DNA polymerase III subunit delta' [Hyphomicrobiales bacterium]